ncbi:hypothetical protein PT7_2208 [Pusillimonas sp. T7-7]|uniref:AAA family ATPase n=1 Tax=Pusillimonas sp. (strain T7-7) TaxID=1007105 RepID=UPI0002085306|nr:AAA family ATPase [Pusillimonas sp. T7-7]AEC20748.1 hypothetical protein PT7_2208 [Pusillimonas sp. T7-7]
MNEPVVEREEKWSAFLARWPLENLNDMTLGQYSQAGNQDCFVYWLEALTESLGSIWGGSAFKFGIYSRKNKVEKATTADRSYGEDYAWYTKYGTSAEEAFERVKEIILSIAKAARDEQLDQIDAADLGPAVKWKLAFLYQSREEPSILPIYKTEWLQAVLNTKERSVAELQRRIMLEIPPATQDSQQNASIFNYADTVWADVQRQIKTELTPESAKAFLDESERFTPIKPATKAMAGYQTSDGSQLGLALDNNKTTIYLSAGEWEGNVQGLTEVEQYPADRSRSSSLAANAPLLAQGNPMVKAVVPDKATLIALCDAYESSETINSSTISSAMATQPSSAPPLNQILYGPPGTGKTFSTIDAALEILDPNFLLNHRNDRSALKHRYDALVAMGNVRFVTFHQSFSYEDFVEGLRAENTDKGDLRYEVADGIFKSICHAAAAKVTKQAAAPSDITGRKIWKLSLGNSLGDDSYIFDECIEAGYALIGYGAQLDFNSCPTRQAIQAHFAANGYAREDDAYELTAINTFVNKMKVGDLVVVTEGNFKFRAIGQVTSDYHLINRDEQGDTYGQCRDVKWIRVYKPSLPHDQLMNNQFSQMTIYELKPTAYDSEKLNGLLRSGSTPKITHLASNKFMVGEQFGSGYKVTKSSTELLELNKPNGKSLPFAMSLLQTLADYVQAGQLSVDDIRDKKVFEKVPDTLLEPYIVNGYANILPILVDRLVRPASTYAGDTAQTSTPSAKVLIIDEINRGNISRIFGELITLIEPSKRAGASESLEVTLPYSKTSFSVPDNLYIIGTMNTADRSLTGLDLALRRRFTFREMPPRPDLLDGVSVEGIDIGKLLATLNERIEVLLDRDHCLGHAYFMSLKTDPSPQLTDLAKIFRLNVIPLLQEYFFEDWQRIQWVLNDHRKPDNLRFITQHPIDQSLFGNDVNINQQSGIWRVNDSAFVAKEAYLGITDAFEPGAV